MRSYCTEKSPRNINQLAWTFVVSGILVATSWWLKWRSFSDIELMVLACRLAAHDGLCFHRRQNGASNLQSADNSNKKNMCCMLHCVLNLSRIITASEPPCHSCECYCGVDRLKMCFFSTDCSTLSGDHVFVCVCLSLCLSVCPSVPFAEVVLLFLFPFLQ